MAPYRRRYYRKRYPTWRRRRIFRRRPTRPFRRRTRRNWVRKKRHYRHYKRKLKKITVKQWQPKKIVKCKIIGNIQLFVCGRTRIAHDFTNYKESVTPVGEASGGAYSFQLFTLDGLYQEFLKHRNIWTKSNFTLPLTRYLGASLTFYKSPFTAYIVQYSICPPFCVSKLCYLNSQPLRQLLEKKKIVIPQLKSGSKKLYKKIKVKPPAMWQTEWYFQQDVCKIGLLFIQATACSLEQPYCPENQISWNYTFYSLNTDMFQQPNFETFGTQGYIPKIVDGNAFHLFVRKIHGTDPPKHWTDVIPLANTNNYTTPHLQGPQSWENFTDKNYWENPFTMGNTHPDAQIYYTTKWPTKDKYTTETVHFTAFNEIYWECRYNPDKDTGKGNKVYFKSNNQNEGDIYTYPSKPELMIENFPLWLIFWGWIDWLAKTVEMQEMYSHYYFVVETDFITPKKKRYIFLDRYFVFPDEKKLTERDKLKWHPKYEQQEEVENFFAESGPFSPKIDRSQSIQANMKYTFYFKWGGCPTQMEDIIPPCNQDRFPVPRKEQPGYEIQDPKTSKTHYLYSWDEHDGIISKKCAKRLKTQTETELLLTGATTSVPYQAQTTESSQTETEEESEEEIQQQFKQLRHKHKQLQQQLHKLIKRQKLE
nr:MAG: ORF1 [TTV-like mini virus]